MFICVSSARWAKLNDATLYFYLRVSAVLATATWLGGWLGGCPSQPVLYQND